MIYDLSRREIPIALTLLCLATAGVVAILHQLWTPAILTVALILVSDVQSPDYRRILAGTACLIAGVLQPTTFVLCIVVLAVWSFWDFGFIGGADAKLLIAILLANGNPAILIPIFLTGGIQGLIARLHHQAEIPFVVSIFLGTILFLATPLIQT